MNKDWILPILAVLGGIGAQFYFAEPGFLTGEGPSPTLVGAAATLFVAAFLAAGLYLTDKVYRLGQWWAPFWKREQGYLHGAINNSDLRRGRVAPERSQLLGLYRMRRFILRRPDEYLCLGNALFYLDELDKAVRCYSRALAAEPKLKEAWYNKGLALGQLGRQREADACLEKAEQQE